MNTTTQTQIPEPLKDILSDALFDDAERNAAFYLSAKKFYTGKEAKRYQEYYDGTVASVTQRDEEVTDEDMDDGYNHLYLIYRFYVFDVPHQTGKRAPVINKPCKLKPIALLNARKYLAERGEECFLAFVDIRQPAPVLPNTEETWPWGPMRYAKPAVATAATAATATTAITTRPPPIDTAGPAAEKAAKAIAAEAIAAIALAVEKAAKAIAAEAIAAIATSPRPDFLDPLFVRPPPINTAGPAVEKAAKAIENM